MANRICKPMELIGYILTPEISPKQDQASGMPENQLVLKNGVMGYAKSATWIVLSIVLSLVLGQLH